MSFNAEKIQASKGMKHEINIRDLFLQHIALSDKLQPNVICFKCYLYKHGEYSHLEDKTFNDKI